MVNENIIPRCLTSEELAARSREEYDSFANYLVFCRSCRKMIRTNMYIMSAETYRDELLSAKTPCPGCNALDWTLGYPENSANGFVKF